MIYFLYAFDVLCLLVLQSGLLEEFNDASVTVVDCPDLTCTPYLLASKGNFIYLFDLNNDIYIYIGY